MRVRSLLARTTLLMSIAASSSAVTMAWTPVGNPGNTCELQSQGCFGAVSYAYSIGTYEVTNAQYAEFLNAKAASDPLGLYDTSMGEPSNSPLGFGGISRTGSSGNYVYSAIAGRENMPVNHVTFFDALRFANWMNNGQGSGTTETGAYTLLGGTEVPSNMSVSRNAGAAIALTSENEWYKAAYYSAVTTSYYNFPTASDASPTCATPTAVANRANCGFVAGDLTPVGSYTGSASPYGTFDQAGNVSEWTESISSSLRAWRNIAFQSDPAYSDGQYRLYTQPEFGSNWMGFRLVFIPEPSTGLLVTFGLLGLGIRRRARG